jgi:hypothetical protein
VGTVGDEHRAPLLLLLAKSVHIPSGLKGVLGWLRFLAARRGRFLTVLEPDRGTHVALVADHAGQNLSEAYGERRNGHFPICTPCHTP